MPVARNATCPRHRAALVSAGNFRYFIYMSFGSASFKGVHAQLDASHRAGMTNP